MQYLANKFDTLIEETISAYTMALVAQEKITQTFKEAAAYGEKAGYKHFMQTPRFANNPEEQTKSLKYYVWQGLIDKTKLCVLMDSSTREKMDNQLLHTPPDVTEENIRGILTDLYNRKDEILAASLLNVFYSLNKKFKSNNKFKLPSGRVIIQIHTEYNRYYHKLTDLDRIFHYMDGKPFEAANYKETIAYRAEYSNLPEIENDYFRIKLFLVGTAHVYFKRADLVEQCNKLIAYHNKELLGENIDQGFFNKKVTP